MKKQGEVGVKGVLLIVLISFIFALVLIFAAEHRVLYSGQSPGTLNANETNIAEDTYYLFNITINNTFDGAAANITQVNITLVSSTFTVVSGSIGTDVSFAYNFTNTSSGAVLSWHVANFEPVNASNPGYVINYTSSRYFWFNATPSTPGYYNITIRSLNDSGATVNERNLSIKVNDTTAPSLIAYNSWSTVSGNYTQNYTYINISAFDNGVIDSVVIRFYNVTSDASLTNSTTSSGNVSLNFTGMEDGFYHVNATVNDTYGNQNTTLGTRYILIDSASPTIAYTSGTISNRTNVSTSAIYVNVTVNESNEHAIVFKLYNLTSGAINTTVRYDGTRSINWTSLQDGVYTINVTVNDTAGNSASTSTYIVTLDTASPTMAFGVETLANYTNVADATAINVNVTINESNIGTINFTLYNITAGTWVVHESTLFTNGTTAMNWTSLKLNQRYEYRVILNDTAGHSVMISRILVLNDTTYPLISFIGYTETPSANLSHNFTYVNVSITETNFKNITFSLFSDSGTTNQTSYPAISVSSGAVGNFNISINWTNLNDGNYSYEINITDVAGNINSTTRKIFLDKTIPTATFSCTPAQVYTDETVTCTCTGNYDLTGVNSTTYTAAPSTADTGLHTQTCTFVDRAGNAASTTTTFIVESYGRNGGGGGSGGDTGKTYTATETQFKQGYTKSLSSGDKIKFSIGTEAHYVTASEITKSSAKITVSSTPQIVTMSIGEEKKFDVTNDGYYDLSVKLNSIKGSKASIIAKSIYEKAPAAPSAVEETPQEEVTQETTGTLSEEAQKSLTWLWITIVVVVILVIGISYWIKNRR